MATIKKAQFGSLIKKAVKKTTKDIIPVAEKNLTNVSPSYNKKGLKMSIERRVNPELAKKKMTKAQRDAFDLDNSYRKNGGPVKKKMQAGGVVKTIKRVGPVDPDGAWTKVQERTIAGKKAPKVPLKKDKQLGATKMKMGGKMKKK